MFLAQRPSPAVIDRFLRDSQELPLSYSPIGIVNGKTSRHSLDEHVVAIGRGKREWYDDAAGCFLRGRAQQCVGAVIWLSRQLQRRMAESERG